MSEPLGLSLIGSFARQHVVINSFRTNQPVVPDGERGSRVALREALEQELKNQIEVALTELRAVSKDYLSTKL